MHSEIRPQPILIEPSDLQAAAAALCCRFGEPSAEARRLGTLHELLGTSRALSRVLEEFATVASVHYRGVHCTADLRSDAERLMHAVASWSEAVFTAGFTYRAWQDGKDLGALDIPLGDMPALTTQYAGLADVTMPPSGSHTA